MATNDITFKYPGACEINGTRRYQVAAGATAINPGEPVYMTALGQQYVQAMQTNFPTINGTSMYLVGVAASSGSQTSTATGVVDVFPVVPGVIYRIAPKVAATFGLTAGSENQTTYSALVGFRVLLDLTTGTYTILASDSALNGCIIENQDVFKAEGKVAFSFRQSASYTM